MTVLPRVTLAVIAFNQEAFIRETIVAAFGQDYPSLQIVLSDDGSSDATFAVMQAMAEAYDGPHDVVLNRRQGKQGILAHVLDAARLGDGDLFIGAAGDDISLPHRTRTLVEHWRRDRPAIIYSAWNRVDVDGRFLSRDGIATQHERDLAAYFPGHAGIAAFGCTTAYAAAFLRAVPDPGRPIWSEDYFLSAVAMLLGERIAYVDEPLVSYRQNPAALRNYATRTIDHRRYEERESRFFDGLAALATSLLEMVDRGVPPARADVDREAIVRDIAWYRYRADWATRSAIDRLRYTVGLRASQRLRWALPRLPGIDAFVAIKTMASPLRRRAGGTALPA